jgi:H+/gluconate symporter-like permease
MKALVLVVGLLACFSRCDDPAPEPGAGDNIDTEEVVEKTSVIGFIVTLVMLLVAGAILLARLLVVEMRDISDSQNGEEEETGDTTETHSPVTATNGTTTDDHRSSPDTPEQNAPGV